MTKSSSRLLSRILLFILVIGFMLFSFNLPRIFKGKFLDIKNEIEKGLSSNLAKDVSIKDIGFMPYGELVLHNLKIRDTKNDISYIDIKKCHVQFNILAFIINRDRVLSRITCREPVFYKPSRNLKIFIGDAPHKLNFSKNISIKLISGRFVFSKSGYIDFNGMTRLRRGKEFYSEGVIDLAKSGINRFLLNDILRYKLEGYVLEDAILIDNLALYSGQFNIGITGNVKDYASSPKLDLKATLKEFKVGNTNINNLYCNIKIEKDELLIKNLYCFLNNFPIGINFKLANFKAPSIEFNLISYPGQLPSLRHINPLNFEASFSGCKHKNSIEGSMVFSTHKLKLNIDDLLCRLSKRVISGRNNMLLSIEADNIIYETVFADKDVMLNMSGFRASLYPDGPRVYLAGSAVSACKGVLKANGFMDFSNRPPRLLLDLKLDNLDMSELASAFKLDYEVVGELNSRGIFNTKAENPLAGRVMISNGYIKNTKLLGLIADFLSVPSLKEIYYKDSSLMVSFSKREKELTLSNINLDSSDINLKADIKIKNMHKVNGKMSVRLSTALLKESFKLRLLFFLIGDRLPYEDFEFEIGGFVEAPHIKWLDTAFKESVRGYLSEGNKKALERALDQAIEQLIKD